MNKNRYRFLVGIDWGSSLHRAVVLDEHGAFLGEYGFEPSAEATARFVEGLRSRLGQHPNSIAVGIEMPHSRFVDILLERGWDVFAIDPREIELLLALSRTQDLPPVALVLAEALRADFLASPLLRRTNRLILTRREDSFAIEPRDRHGPDTLAQVPLNEKGPRAATLRPEDPSHLSPVKGETR